VKHEPEIKPGDRELVDVTNTAQLLSVGRRTVWKLIADGDLESVRIGDRRLVPRDAIRNYTARLRVEPANAANNGGTQKPGRKTTNRKTTTGTRKATARATSANTNRRRRRGGSEK
jgi:excisionase family DNA binding protein